MKQNKKKSMGEGFSKCWAWNAFSKSCVLRAKKLGGDGLAVSNRSLPVKICGQDVRVKFLHVVVQFVPVNKDLREKCGECFYKRRRLQIMEQVQRSLQSYPLQQLALHEGFDNIVSGGEVPGLVSDVHRFKTGWEGVLRNKAGNN